MKKTNKKQVGIIGLGSMGEALLRGILQTKMTGPDEIIVSDTSEDRLNFVHREFKVSVTKSNPEVVKASSLVLLSVKPQVSAAVLLEIRHAMTPTKLLASVVAGLPISRIMAGLGTQVKVIRVMSNAPALIREGATAIAPGEGVEDKDLKKVQRLFEAIGRVVIVDERDMDVITGLSGSGPAYLFMVIEALADGGVRMGLSREVALFLAAQTTLGAARMVLDTGGHPAILKEKVTSPGGTTMAGLHALEDGGIRGAFISAVKAATERAQELGRTGGK
ncbi:MAG: pyrroline-5-carboxylate reductase [Deltaproteobacteria bacterium]|nr:pyrroline-5-carboxylate reductase [Deltaproteobacteria bacterium]